MSDHNLTVGSARLSLALRKKFPDLSGTELDRLASVLLTEVSKRIAEGDQIAFVRQTDAGKVELTILGLEIQAKREP